MTPAQRKAKLASISGKISRRRARILELQAEIARLEIEKKSLPQPVATKAKKK